MQIRDMSDLAQLQQTMEWLTEHRQKDREAIERLSSSLERFAKVDAERGQAVARLDGELQRVRQQLDQVPALADSMKQSREFAEALAARVEALSASFTQAQQVSSLESGRDRRALADLVQQVSELQRHLDAQHTRVQALAETVRRDKGETAPLGGRIEETEKITASLVSRLRQVEDHHRRSDGQFVVAQQRDEMQAKETARLENALKLADLRWSRQIADWQQQLDRWRSELDEKTRPLHGLGQQLVRLSEVDQALAERSEQIARRIEAVSAVVHRIEGTAATTRDHVTQLHALVEEQQKRIDEAASGGWQIGERVARVAKVAESLGLDIARERVRIDEMRASFEEVEQRRLRLTDLQDGLQQRVHDVETRLVARLEELQVQIVGLQQQMTVSLGTIERRQLLARERNLATLQVEIHELAEALGLRADETVK